ncbi:hypothetical protein RBH29_04085 [Herbivorax sp. ANBcel31]|uniref:hypothetical protein n=1 Tax=Herbivorax sp. ANBcel31 TaxID=3069754 RepID=UPI0027B872A7|nr:hypothetical protein [Herbivorax sp. ANBcel31]MDQ2085613.1 hypothetical protein [Herbivorax sp. ANBcel31]
MKKFLKRNYTIIILFLLTISVSLFNSFTFTIDVPATDLGGLFTAAFILLWIAALFISMHKTHVMVFSIIFWSVFAITSILRLSFDTGDLPIIVSRFFSFSLRIFYSSLYGVTRWLNNANIPIITLLTSIIFIAISIIFLRKGRCKLYKL